MFKIGDKVRTTNRDMIYTIVDIDKEGCIKVSYSKYVYEEYYPSYYFLEMEDGLALELYHLSTMGYREA